MDVLCEEMGGREGGREDYPADDARYCQGFEGGAGQCAEELWDGGGGCEGEDVKGTDWHFDILQDVSIYN